MIASSKPPRPQPYCLFETAIGTCGIAWNERMEDGGPIVGGTVQLTLEVEAILQQD